MVLESVSGGEIVCLHHVQRTKLDRKANSDYELRAVTPNPTPTALAGRKKFLMNGPGRNILLDRQKHFGTASSLSRNSIWHGICSSTRG